MLSLLSGCSESRIGPGFFPVKNRAGLKMTFSESNAYEGKSLSQMRFKSQINGSTITCNSDLIAGNGYLALGN